MGAIFSGLQGARAISESFSEQVAIGGLPDEILEALKSIATFEPDLEISLSENLAEELPLLKRDGGFVRPQANREIDELRGLRDQSRRIIAQLQMRYSDETGIKSLKIRHNNVLGYFIEVTAQNAEALQKEEVRGTYIHRQSMANAMRFTTTELAELETKIANAAGRILDLEISIFDQLVENVLVAGDGLQKIARALSVLDVSSSLARLAQAQNYTRPVVDETTAFEIKGGRHAVVEQMLKNEGGQSFIANDCSIGSGDGSPSGNIWLLTGPNMGGKSTFLRQNALIAIMAQMGSFVPAQKAHIGVVDRLFSRVGAADDLARGRSTFMVEMVETAAILNQAGPRSLVILDEIGRGTATFDGLSIAWAAIEQLHEVNQCRTLFATHFHELTALSAKLQRLSNVTLKVKEWQGDVVFLHEIVSGVADRSYGIQVARLAGLPDAVIARAKDVLDQLESSDSGKSTLSLVDELPLFSVKQKPAPVPVPKEDGLKKAIEAILPDDLSPREALEQLYKLKAMVRER